MELDRGSKGTRYYRNAVKRHWESDEIDLSEDSDRLVESLQNSDDADEVFDILRQSVARFGAGEQAVTENLAPLATALDNLDDQMFITTQIYQEAKHTDFFDRYWREVIHAAEDELGDERSPPTDPVWYNDAYDDLFDRNERAMHALLEDRSPETVAKV